LEAGSQYSNSIHIFTLYNVGHGFFFAWVCLLDMAIFYSLLGQQIAWSLIYLFAIDSMQGLRDSGIGSQGITNSILMMTKTKSTVINLPSESYTMG